MSRRRRAGSPSVPLITWTLTRSEEVARARRHLARRGHLTAPLCERERVPMPDPQPETQLDELTRLMREFSEQRDWVQFHDPKSLILALVGEVGELAELFQWSSKDDALSVRDDPARRARAGEEMADVLLYLVRLADVLNVDLMDASRSKHAAARRRFSIDGFRGKAPERE